MKLEQQGFDDGRRKAIGWATNVGLLAVLAMAWGAKHWPAASDGFLAMAATMAMVAIIFAVRELQRNSVKPEDADVHGVDVDTPLSGAIFRNSMMAFPPSSEGEKFHFALQPASYWQADEIERRLAEIRRESIWRLMDLHRSEVRQVHFVYRDMFNIGPTEGSRNLDLSHLVGKKYSLDFGTVKIEIDGENARIDLAKASNVKIENGHRSAQQDFEEDTTYDKDISKDLYN